MRVRLHSLAEPLFGRHPSTRLAAMFSLPFVVSSAVLHDRVDPAVMTPGTPAFVAAESFSERVEVAVDERLDRYLPELRCTEVTVLLTDGSTVGLAQPNPVGDTDHFPLGPEDVEEKLTRLLGEADARSIVSLVAALPSCESVTGLLDRLP